jgi:hypothetical protein
MAGLRRLWIAIKAVSQVGAARLIENGLYRLSLRFNLTSLPSSDGREVRLNLEALPPCEGAASETDEDALMAEANEIVEGRVRLFGRRAAQALELAPEGELRPWADYERGAAKWEGEDIKFCWEPARFGWAVTLARAYLASGDEHFARAFWVNLETFREGNPAYNGPNWTSGQEVGLRIIMWGFVLRTLAGSAESSPERMAGLANFIGVHAARIPPTLMYARSQDNNHLLSEAAGLYTAGLLLPEHSQAAAWRKQGWRWFNRALQRQIGADGSYIQQSVNYHRMLLQLSLWVDALARRSGDRWSAASRERLAAATNWMWARLDPESGRAPNLGHNDGTHVFAFGAYADQRPTVQAAGRAFLWQELLAAGAWDELSGWLGLEVPAKLEKSGDEALPRMPLRARQGRRGVEAPPLVRGVEAPQRDTSGVVLRAGAAWASLRAAQLQHRPGQADQLQVDLWHHGMNVILDAGTYRYNAAPPWDNGLASGGVHNGVTIDGREPMTRGGRFLWLDWDQARVVSCIPGCAVAERDGYRRMGVRHKRTLECLRDGSWVITDDLARMKPRSRAHEFGLCWLLPDGEWRLEAGALSVDLAGVQMIVRVECLANPAPQVEVMVVRAGELLAGEGTDVERLGWFSPTYAERQPALSLCVRVRSTLPLKLRTVVQFVSP